MWLQRQRFQISTLQIAPPPTVVHQSLGNGGQQRPRFAYRLRLRQSHNLSKHLGSHVSGIMSTTQPRPQATEQPTMMVAEKTVENGLPSTEGSERNVGRGMY